MLFNPIERQSVGVKISEHGVVKKLLPARFTTINLDLNNMCKDSKLARLNWRDWVC